MQQQYRYSTGTGTVDSTPVVSWQRTRKACSSFVQLYSLVQYMYRVMYRYSRGPFAKSFPEGAFCKKSGGRGPIANRRSRKGAFYGFPINLSLPKALPNHKSILQYGTLIQYQYWYRGTVLYLGYWYRYSSTYSTVLD